MRKSTLQIIILAGIVALFAGCAVLTVDMDVYKGSLANHKDVQTEQMAAMAIGAKPLLVELRDTLEAKGPKGDSLRDAADFREQANAECWYKPTYIGPAQGQTKSRLENQNADRVNDVLSLYEDLEDEQYSLFVRRANQALKDYSVAYMILKPDSPLEDEKVWKKIGLKKDGFKNEAKLLLGDGKKQEVKELAREIEELRGDYKKFCTSTGRNARGIFVNWNKIRARLETGQVKLPDWLQNNPLLNGKDKELEISSNAAFRALARTSLADFQAEHLFGLKGKKRNLFVNHVEKISRAFLAARENLERLWRVEIEAIIWLSNQPADIRLERDRLMHEIAKASLETIQSQHVVVLSKLIDEESPGVPDGFTELRAAMGEQPCLGKHWKRPHYKKAKRKLLNAFTKQPGKTAKRLLDCHIFSQSTISASTLTDKGLDPNYHTGYVSGWEFGFARGPFTTLAPPDMTKRVEGAFPSGVFAKGRLPEGLQTLIEEYLKMASNCNAEEDDVECARKRLSDALVRFAEKLLFVANNDILLRDPTHKDIGLIGGAADVVTRAALGFPLKPPDLTTRYTRILQAVGNSILVQADALRQEEDYASKLKGRVKSEIVAINRTLNQPPPMDPIVVDKCMLGDKNKATAKDVRDVWITLLGYEHDLALRNGQKERADQIQRALEAARKKREGMIFIRPAMAYLRTSFPSTSLQDNPNLTWDNMLGVHATRSIPFAPQLGELFNPDAKRDAMITAEIDKQFWQNINRVRVAGGGNTNYVVAKDDIGNWYVKGYSADQKDIINSAKNLAMFSLSAKIPAGSPEIDVEEPDVEDTPLGGLFARHKKNYDTQTEDDLGVLRKIFEDGKTKKIETQIESVWKQNKAISPNDKLPTSLKGQLTKASDRHLKPVREKIKQKDNEAQQAGLIIEGLDALRQFGGSLITAIKNLDLNNAQDVEAAKTKLAVIKTDLEAAEKILKEVNKEVGKSEIKIEAAKTKLATAQKNLEEAKKNLEGAKKDVEAAAVGAVRDIVRREIMELVKRRKRAVEDYEMAILFIGDAVAD